MSISDKYMVIYRHRALSPESGRPLLSKVVEVVAAYVIPFITYLSVDKLCGESTKTVP